MIKLWRNLKADLMKMKHTPFLWIHVGIPLVAISLFLGYALLRKVTTADMMGAYLEAIAMAYPIIISIICFMVVEQEAEAGNFKEMLGSICGKGVSLLSKVIMLLLLGGGALIITIMGFAIGLSMVSHEQLLPLSFYGHSLLALFGSQILLYLFHLWLSFTWGAGISIGIGVFETLVSALMHTGLGDGRWQWLPCGWGMRFVDYGMMGSGRFKPFSQMLDYRQGVENCILFTIIGSILFFVWFRFYEGQKDT